MSISASQTLEPLPGTYSKMWCDTYLDITHISYRWTIHNFSMRPEENGTYFDSSTFASDGSDEIKWCLRIYPKGNTNCIDNLSLYLHLKTSKDILIRAKYKFSILNGKQEEKRKRCSVDTFSPKASSWGYSKFIERDFLTAEANGLLCDDKLALYCEVDFSSDSTNISSRKKRSEVPGCQLSEDFGKLFQNKDLGDVTLNVKGRVFLAHKIILSARSPVFAAMFKHDVKETKQKRVEIIDIEPEVVKEILNFIYTGKSPRLDEMADALLAAANKYALDGLKAL